MAVHALVKVKTRIFRDSFNPGVLAVRTRNQRFHATSMPWKVSCIAKPVNGAKV